MQNLRKFERILSQASRSYVDEIESDVLVEAAIRGMLGKLDPHSVYIPPKEKKKVDEEFQANFDGIGVQFDILNDTITVVTPIVGGPSEKIGIFSGDKIVTINGEDATGLTTQEVPKKLKGPKGTEVTVGIKRAGIDSLLSFDIIRDKIPIYTVDASFIIDKTDIGYITVNRFAATTHQEVVDAAKTLKSAGMKRLVLDLRGNPGGFLDQAVRLADEFLPNGKKIVYTKGRRPEHSEEFFSTTKGGLEDIPLVIMINAGSASASEIVSGAVQDLDRGLIVGETSFGKGLVQRQFSLDDGSAFRITTARYYTPSGRSIQRPYENEEEYYSLVGRDDVEEGENLEHAGEGDSTRPSFETKSGRIVYGGGGIVPDYVVKPDSIGSLRIALFQKNIFREFTDRFMQGKGKQVSSMYKDNFTNFLRNYEIDAETLAQMKTLAEEREITWTDENFATDKEAILTTMKAHLARQIWNNNEFYVVYHQMDRQLQKAVTLFPEAKKIAKLH
jgi:carboxyl-terminal processing protease